MMDPKTLGSDKKPPLTKICSICRQFGHKHVDCHYFPCRSMLGSKIVLVQNVVFI